MSTGMTTIGSPEIEDYCEAVRVALGDLPGPLRDDLIEDLPDHLAEVLAEGDGSLRDRLGEPAAYANELRAAAGLDPASGDAASGGLQAGLVSVARRTAEVARRLDGQLGRPLGYTRLSDLLQAVRPGWWVLRGWIVAQFVGGVRGHRGWHGVIPRLGGNHVVGLLATVALIAASVWLGRRSQRFTVWPRRVVVGLSIVIAVWAATVLTSSITNSAYASSDGSAYLEPATPAVNDVYVYDQNGNPVPNARLFDQDGTPIQLGSGVCNDGNQAPGTGSDLEATDAPDEGVDPSTQQWTYPLCPSDPGPFRSGPGPVTSPPADGAASSAPSSAAVPSPGASNTGAPGAGASSAAAPGAGASSAAAPGGSRAASRAPKGKGAEKTAPADTASSTAPAK